MFSGITFGLLTDLEGLDAAAILAGARLARKSAATPPLAGYAEEETFPGAETIYARIA